MLVESRCRRQRRRSTPPANCSDATLPAMGKLDLRLKEDFRAVRRAVEDDFGVKVYIGDVPDPNTGSSSQVRPKEFLSVKQMKRMGWRPDMVWQFARYLAQTQPRSGEKPLEIRARMFVSINGR